MFAKWFVDEVYALYPNWSDLHAAIKSGSGIIGRYLNDASHSGIGYKEVLSATSLDQLQRKAEIIKRENDLYSAYISGRCYDDQESRRKGVGCPRIYAQASNDKAALDAFSCPGVGFIPNCPKFITGECWNRFDKLGLKMRCNDY